jgi:hypothetical protein
MRLDLIYVKTTAINSGHVCAWLFMAVLLSRKAYAFCRKSVNTSSIKQIRARRIAGQPRTGCRGRVYPTLPLHVERRTKLCRYHSI